MPGTAGPARAILFDLDGTLVDTYSLYLESYRRALAPYLGREPTLEDFLQRQPASERHFLNQWIGPDAAAACHADVQRYYAELHASLCEGPYDGVREMLAALRSVGIPLGIVTGKARAAWEVTRRAIDLGAFDVVITEDDVPRPKPHPGGLNLALAAIAVEAADAVYIGDSRTDLEAGRQAGSRVAAALWPKTAPGEKQQFAEQIRPLDPDWVFERPADVVHALAMWCH